MHNYKWQKENEKSGGPFNARTTIRTANLKSSNRVYSFMFAFTSRLIPRFDLISTYSMLLLLLSVAYFFSCINMTWLRDIECCASFLSNNKFRFEEFISIHIVHFCSKLMMKRIESDHFILRFGLLCRRFECTWRWSYICTELAIHDRCRYWFHWNRLEEKKMEINKLHWI